MSDPVAVCECGNEIVRHPRGGTTPKRCAECRRAKGLTNSKRGTERESSGPLVAIRRMVAALPSDQYTTQGDVAVTMHVACAAAALTAATGLPEGCARNIVEAMQVLVEQGESGVEIRRRLNSNGFGRSRAVEARTAGGIWDYLHEAEAS